MADGRVALKLMHSILPEPTDFVQDHHFTLPSKGRVIVVDQVERGTVHNVVEFHENVGGEVIEAQKTVLSQKSAARRKRKSRANAAVRQGERDRENQENARRRQNAAEHRARLEGRRLARLRKKESDRARRSNLMKVRLVEGVRGRFAQTNEIRGVYRMEISRKMTEVVNVKHRFIPDMETQGAEVQGKRNLVCIDYTDSNNITAETVSETAPDRRSKRRRM